MSHPGRLLVALTAVLAACGGGEVGTDAVAPTETSGPACDPPTAPTEPGWRPLAPSPLSPRAGAITAWTGCELLLFKGRGNFNDGCTTEGEVTLCGEPPRNDGAAYNPATDMWRPLPASPLEDDRSSGLTMSIPAGAWTGQELLVVGGEGWGAATYSPATDTWRALPDPPLVPRGGFSLTVVGRQAILFGGSAFGGEEEIFHADGAVLDLDTGDWRPLPEPPAGPRLGHAALSLDGEVVLVGGVSDFTRDATEVEAYDVEDGSWRRLASLPVGSRGEAVVVGGDIVAVRAGDDRDRTFVLAHGAEAWTEVGRSSFDTFASPSLAAVGNQVVAVGGSGFMGRVEGMEASALDLATDEWRPLPDPPLGIGERSSVSLVWTGAEILAWGGEVSTGFTSKTAADGARLALGP